MLRRMRIYNILFIILFICLKFQCFLRIYGMTKVVLYICLFTICHCALMSIAENYFRVVCAYCLFVGFVEYSGCIY